MIKIVLIGILFYTAIFGYPLEMNGFNFRWVPNDITDTYTKLENEEDYIRN